MALHELHRRDHLTVARRLKKPHVRRVGVDHVHLFEVDALTTQLAAKLDGDDEIGGDGDRGAVDQKEGVAEVRIQVRLHDQIRRLPVRQPDAADRGDRGADHDGVPDREPQERLRAS